MLAQFSGDAPHTELRSTALWEVLLQMEEVVTGGWSLMGHSKSNCWESQHVKYIL